MRREASGAVLPAR